MTRGWGYETPHDEAAAMLSVKELRVVYNSNVVLDRISFELNKGEHIAVVGPNGAGKSTLFKLIAGVLKPTEGHIAVAGHGPVEHICIAYIPQRNQIDWSFPVTVSDVVMMGRAGRLGWWHRPRNTDRDAVRDYLSLVGLEELSDRRIGELSGGEQQRMFIARALAQEAELMLMDEVLAGCDLPSEREIFRILDRLRERRVTILMATHDLDQAATHFDRVMLLNRRLIGMGHPESVFTPENLRETYGSHLRLVQTEAGLMVLSDTCCEGGESKENGRNME